jgi:hypothetical protein
MTLAFRLDLGLYYMGVVAAPFQMGECALEIPAFARRGSRQAAAVLALYNRRFATMARDRMARGTWGRRNNGRFFGFISYQLDRRLKPRIAWALVCWLLLELREGWRTWFAPAPQIAAETPRRSTPSTSVQIGAAGSSTAPTAPPPNREREPEPSVAAQA